MTRFDESRVARPRQDDWPTELSHLRVGLVVSAAVLSASGIVLVVLALVVFSLVWSFLVGGHIQSVMERWWGAYVADVVSAGIRGGVFALVVMKAASWCKRARTRRYVEVLLAHGYCPCGYKYVEQGIIRSCPECGRHWTAKQPPRE
jgi:hypothetical protein